MICNLTSAAPDRLQTDSVTLRLCDGANRDSPNWNCACACAVLNTDYRLLKTGDRRQVPLQDASQSSFVRCPTESERQ
jgi:hypothetical protein